MSFLKDTLVVLQLALQLLPTIMNIVRAIEVPGFGAEKLALITKTVTEAFNLLPPDVKKQIGGDKIDSFVKNLVSYIVTFFNAVGIFSK
jgi:hypothetical protein